MSSVDDVAAAGARLGPAASVADVLAAAFDAFEVIRLLARASEDQAPGLFAAFMATANAAVEGREALTAAPSLPPGPGGLRSRGPAVAGRRVEEVTAALAALGTLLAERLGLAAAQAGLTGDREACAQAADAARLVAGIMAGDGDDRLW